ncbi:RDD family protein [Mycolicibacterium tokaiense]|uniref:RDD family protein n=1 Tax=Mycolicibacterium tokaiense TaxID=39695 RepID=UPI000E1B6D10|nr:RDD family protein [Mycolicibacterium tokaiense]BBY89756.1 RDD family protein [Mycolicibacterium tokaiense]
MPSALSSWLSGPEPADSGHQSTYPGEAFDLPESGPRSVARSGRRFAALLVDWLIAYGLAGLCISLGLFSAPWLSTAVLVIWLVLGAVSVRLFSFTPGQYALGLMVVSVDNRMHVGIGRALGRGLLLTLVIPALFMDSDMRGMQDKFTFTAVVRR